MTSLTSGLTSGLNYEPHPYQRYATDFIKGHPISAILLSMGLGKTVITLTAINELLYNDFDVGKVLVIAPLRVCTNVWKQEAEKWSHLQRLNISVAVGTERQRLAALNRKADIYVINRENTQWLVEASGVPFDFDMLVIDELSSFKNPQSKRFRALMKVRPQVKRVVGLTGTPSSNGLMDLWAQFRLLDLGRRLGRFIGTYRSDYFLPDKRRGQVIYSYKPLPQAQERIYEKISDITISMNATDHLSMPECLMNEIPVRLSEKERKVYETMKRDLILSLEGQEITAGSAASLANKLLQMANGAVYASSVELLPTATGPQYAENHSVAHLHDRKLDALEDLIEAANGQPVLIAYWFRHDRQRILARFSPRTSSPNRAPAGDSVPAMARIPAQVLDTAESIRRWNAGEIPVALIHPAAAGHGLNLQAGGSTLIWFGLTWSLELYQQTNARLWRQGQKDTVVIHHLIATGTMDEQVMTALKRKDKTQMALIRAVKANISEGQQRR